MKYIKYNIILLITFILFILSSTQITLDFDKNEPKELKNKKEFIFDAKYNKNTKDKNYLYIYTRNYEDSMNSNKAIVKIFFKQIPENEMSQDIQLNYLNSDYSSIDFNTGLFIPFSKLQYNTAKVFILSYENCHLRLEYSYEKDISFPTKYKYSNFQLNQFVLPKGKTETINYKIQNQYNDYLLILSKTSLKNIDISVKYKNSDVTEEKMACLYPNGCSIFLDKKALDDNYLNVEVTINNKKSNNDEILLLGYEHHYTNELFPNEVVNGFQLYLEGNKTKLNKLMITGNSSTIPYFTYQTYSKKLEIEFLTEDNKDQGTETIIEYNAVFTHKINFKGKMGFQFYQTPKRNALYFQYLDYFNNEVAQKSLQPLVTGIPKSMFIPKKKSMYHFLPIERDSSQLHYYLRPKTKEIIYASFEICDTYPQNCTFVDKRPNSVEPIQNIGLWYTLKTKRSELQLIYIYCENDCSYDIIMSYDDDPLFLFPENNYTKIIGDSGKDTFVLPVFEYLEIDKTESLYIDLTIISGNADLTLKNRRSGDKINSKLTQIGKKKYYSLSFSNQLDYYKKEIEAIVEQSTGYKNTIYNIMYGSGKSNQKILSNNIVNIESLTVPEVNKEEDNAKTFIFINKNGNYHISISTHTCKIIVESEGKKYDENYYFHQSPTTNGEYKFKVYLVRDDEYCTSGFEEEVILFAYNSDINNVLLSENTFINSSISSNVSFIYLFKPNNEEGVDNSFNIEIESLNKDYLKFNYQFRRISFNGLNERNLSETSAQKIVLKNYKYISNEQIKKICNLLQPYEVCSFTMTLIPPSQSSSQFSLKLRKNNYNYAKNLTAQTLISSVNTINAQYFYIDINKNNKIRLLINSYGQDLQYKYKIITEKKEDKDILPLGDSDYSEGSNAHQKTIQESEFSKCNSFCRLYIGIKTFKGSSNREGSTSFLIGYQYYDEKNTFSDINLPLNYFFQYTLDSSEEVNYILYPFENVYYFLELFVIKNNENDDTEVTASIGSTTLTSTQGKTTYKSDGRIIKVNLKVSKGNKSTFKFRLSNIGQQIIPMISSYGEKCLLDTCYYLLDDLTSEKLSFDDDDNINKFVYFYIPENENAVISYKLLKYDAVFNTETFDSTSKDLMKRKNWLQIPILNNNENSVIIKLENAKSLSLCSTNYNKPNTVTLNYGETRMFSIQRKILDKITFYIKKEKNENKVRIKLHAIKGNGIFKFSNEIYPLGFENAYKEDISIIISDIDNIQLNASNEKNEKADEYDDFVFTIEYTIDKTSQFLYEVYYDKINSFKFYQKKEINDIIFYLNFTERQTNDLNINIKIYSDEAIYNVDSYFVDKEFIENKLKDSALQPDNYNSAGKIKTYIQGGKPKNNIFTFSKMEISSDILKKQNTNKNTFIYINFKLKEIKENYNVKIDLYPYNTDNINFPLASNQLFIQKIPAKSEEYKLFFAKSDIYYNEPIIIHYLFPLKKSYDYYATYVSENERLTIIRKEKLFGKDELTINLSNDLNKKKLSFNLVPKNKEELKKDELFIFSYKNTKSIESNIVYREPTNFFEVSGNSKKLNYTLDAPVPLLGNGNTILIIRIYEQDDIKDLLKKNLYDDMNDNSDDDIHYYLPLYLLFSDIEPIYTKYEVWDNKDRFSTRWTTINDIKKGGDLYFTAVSVIEDNEREIYFAYKGILKNIENEGFLQDLLNYIKDHIFASIVILIVIIIILGMLINICRMERKSGRLSSIKVDVEGQLMEDKS